MADQARLIPHARSVAVAHADRLGTSSADAHSSLLLAD